MPRSPNPMSSPTTSSMFGFASLDWSPAIADEVKIATATPKKQATIERTDCSPLLRRKVGDLRKTISSSHELRFRDHPDSVKISRQEP